MRDYDVYDRNDDLLCDYCDAWPCECGLGYEEYEQD